MSGTEFDKHRLDLLMVQKKLVSTRSRARDLIKNGYVKVGGTIITKAGQLLPINSDVRITDKAPDYVSRGGVKLQHALSQFDINVAGKTVLDLGASTGGFTEVLLRNGATHIYAVDVGHNQLHHSLKGNVKITSMEGQDARKLKSENFNRAIHGITIDVSFISLTKALEAPLNLVAKGGWLIALVKPQFEIGKKALGKGGIVRNVSQREAVIENICSWLNNKPGWEISGACDSPISGQGGNHEYLIAAQHKS